MNGDFFVGRIAFGPRPSAPPISRNGFGIRFVGDEGVATFRLKRELKEIYGSSPVAIDVSVISLSFDGTIPHGKISSRIEAALKELGDAILESNGDFDGR